MKRKLLCIGVIISIFLLGGCGNGTDDKSGQLIENITSVPVEITKPSDNAEKNDTTAQKATVIEKPELVSKKEKFLKKEMRYTRSGSLAEYTEYEYDNKWKMIKEKYQEVDYDFSYYYEYEYDNNGNLLRQNSYSSDGSLSGYIEYENDANGNIIMKKYFYCDGRLSNYTEMVYDDNGKLIKETDYDTLDAYDSDSGYWEYSYNGCGNMIKRSHYSMDGIHYCDWLCQYDNNGHLLKEDCMDYLFGATLSNEYEYDQDGYKIKCTEFSNGEIVSVYQYEYFVK